MKRETYELEKKLKLLLRRFTICNVNTTIFFSWHFAFITQLIVWIQTGNVERVKGEGRRKENDKGPWTRLDVAIIQYVPKLLSHRKCYMYLLGLLQYQQRPECESINIVYIVCKKQDPITSQWNHMFATKQIFLMHK